MMIKSGQHGRNPDSRNIAGGEYTPWMRLAAAIIIRAIYDLHLHPTDHISAVELSDAREFLMSAEVHELGLTLGIDLKRGLKRLGI